MRTDTVRAVLLALISGVALAEGTTEFCLNGEFDLGVRNQGMRPAAGELYPARWCVVSEDGSERVRFSASGNSNPDMHGDWTVALLPPDLVRIVNAGSPPDVEFAGADSLAEARRHRRIDPQRLIQELDRHDSWIGEADEAGWRSVQYPGESTPVQVQVEEGRLLALATRADLPLRGRVPVIWRWNWAEPARPWLAVYVDGQLLFAAGGAWRTLDAEEAARVWTPTPGADPRQVPGEYWPARVDMQLVTLDEGVYLVRTVRTGFQHLVVDTAAGLVVADAPAGWAELHQVPPADLVPGLAISGLSEKLIDFLAGALPDRPIRAVALTHAHDDHAGGARAFAAAGAGIYAPKDLAAFLQTALNHDGMPPDRLREAGGRVTVTPSGQMLTLPDDARPIQLLSLGESPHSAAALGMYLPEQGIFFQSDLHVPRSESDVPRADRAATECWFAGWAVRHLPPEARVINTHSTIETPVARLAQYLQSDVCRDLSPKS